MKLCDYCHNGAPATHRVRWTRFGGVLVTKHVCDYHASTVGGQRGVELSPVVVGRAGGSGS
jgi:hypothetical protein